MSSETRFVIRIARACWESAHGSGSRSGRAACPRRSSTINSGERGQATLPDHDPANGALNADLYEYTSRTTYHTTRITLHASTIKYLLR